MSKKSFVTSMPDKSGTFLRASRIIAENGGNIVRVSYNKAVDPHMLFIDVEAFENDLINIENALADIGYINKKYNEIRVIEISVRIPDKSGAILPVLEVLNRYDINISYMNSVASDQPFQNFKFGLLIENPGLIKTILDEISRVYQINVIDCDSSEENLDNTVFYIKLANEMQGLLNLTSDKTMEFIAESNRILQALQNDGEMASKVFDYIRRFAYFVSSYRGENYKADVAKLKLSEKVTLFNIQPYCGSNTYLLVSDDELTVIDTGYAIFADEILRIFNKLVPDFENREKKIYITHADVDHCGLLSKLNNARIIVNQKSAESFKRQISGIPDFREKTQLNTGYSKISRLISAYVPPDYSRLEVFDHDTPEQHDDLLRIGEMSIADLNFVIYEGSGGHISGEMVYVCFEEGIAFTGDILVNISDFSKERAEFNSLAPYLMKSVNVDSKRATQMRHKIIEIIEDISSRNGKPCLVCGGHGPISYLSDRKLIKL
ncbi:MAG TPA: MBL fold metallo-hydrolase [Ruminiclostridium sp.]|nr:MBL fold metallo-hydrolase [Ruminiclostridium sp.]